MPKNNRNRFFTGDPARNRNINRRRPLDKPVDPTIPSWEPVTEYKLTRLPDGAADGAYDQTHFRTRINPTSF